MTNTTKNRELIKGLPEITCADEAARKAATRKSGLYAPYSNISLDRIKSSFGIALHMHQPMIMGESYDLQAAELISNLRYMMENQHIGDNHNAPVFLRCYSRISDFIRELAANGKNPRVMLDYSGNLLWGLVNMGEAKVIDNLALITCDKKYYRHVEWLGTMWSHAVVTSTPVPDIILHIRAWQEHFAALFGLEALERVKGFSPPEMHLPIYPDMCYAYIKALKECGYEWLMAQEHTIENMDGSGIRRPHFPHRLVARNSLGQVEEIIVLVKTQGSDTKLVAQMQPYYEAQSRGREEYAGRVVPPFVCQISDGENGGVMMNEFPPMYNRVMGEIGAEGTVALNGSEYLGLLRKAGVDEKSFIPVQPASQHRIWEFVGKYEPGAVDRAVEKAKLKYPGMNLEKGSWTNDRDWVRNYGDVMDPINKLSAQFHRRFDNAKSEYRTDKYKLALLYLLLSQTSCYRYWGQGIWTEYAKEICRRGMDAASE